MATISKESAKRASVKPCSYASSNQNDNTFGKLLLCTPSLTLPYEDDA